jgi:restriction endonuclease S subunit
MSSYAISPTLNKNRVFILQKSEMETRLDPFYYVPELVELEKKVLAKKPKKLRDYVKGIASGATPKTTESEKYYAEKENGVPFLRVQNLSPTSILEFDDCKYINEETHNGMLKRSQVSAGDLLVKITGVGRMAVASVAPEGFEGNINQHICVIKTGSKEISETLAAFLNSDIGERLASRRSTGGTRPALDYPALLSIPILNDKRILAITKKVVEQKKQNEAEAEKLLLSIDDYFLKELGIILPTPPENVLKNRIFTATLKDISGGRFDPKLYSIQSRELIESLYKTKFKQRKLKSVIIQSCSGDWGSEDKELFDKNNFVRCLVIRATEFDNKFNLNVDGSRAKFRLIDKTKYQSLDIQTNDLLIEKSGGSENQPVGRISILTKELTDNYLLGFSNFVHKIRVDEKIVSAEFVFNYLKTIHNIKITDVMQSQTNGIRNLILNEYFNLPIPVPSPEKQEEIAEHIKSIRQQAQRLKDKTKEVLANASKEIEKILVGNV